MSNFQKLNLTGFLFGSIDEKGELENDVFDDDSRKHLDGLNVLGFSSPLREITQEEDDDGYNTDWQTKQNEGEVKAEDDAEDYSNIDEAVEVREEKDIVEVDEHIENKGDSDLMPPPNWRPRKESPMRQTSPDKKPLSDLLPDEYKDIDVRQLFPEFEDGKVLRFTRLFKPQYMPKLYKNPNKDKKSIGEKEETEDPLFTWEWSSDSLVGKIPKPEELAEDDMELMLKPIEKKSLSNDKKSAQEKDNSDIAPWRYGPSQYWYDLLGVDESGRNFDYGFKKREYSSLESANNIDVNSRIFPDEAYHMVTQTHWEDEVIWNPDDVRHRILSQQKMKAPLAGWIPNNTARTYSQFVSQFGASSQSHRKEKSYVAGVLQASETNAFDKTTQSIFPVENPGLVYGRWEDDIIWDVENMENIPEPAVLTLDANDENIILKIPDDEDPNDRARNTQKQKEQKKEVKKSKLILGKAGIINVEEEEEEKPTEEQTDDNKDPFNLSNDEYYNPKLVSEASLKSNVGAILQHSTPAVELRQPFFPTHNGGMRLRQWHRPPLKRYSHGAMTADGPHQVLPLLKNIRRKEKQRELERLASGGGEMFFMRTADDLSARDGTIVLVEYCEEYPPLLSQVGMASKIKNYYKRKPGKDVKEPVFKFGDISYVHQSPFLGQLAPGQCLQAVENNMYRSPIYEHEVNVTDFLIIRNRNNYFIREIETIFTSGQACPLMEVPGPNSKRANNFIKEFLQVFIYRLFWKSPDNPRRIKMEEIKKSFPSHSESSIRKRLKLCADFKRTGTDSNWWVLKQNFRLPSEEEMRAMVSPEQCCAYYSLLAAEQRLTDAGYGEKSLFAPEEENDDEQSKIEDEVRTAPWNTTRAYIAAMKGKCLLDLSGVADPTGCGEGFSYIKMPNKPTQPKTDDPNVQTKKTVTGTDADLRRLYLKDAKQILRNHGIPENEIKQLSRWDVIDLVRTVSTHQVKTGQEGEEVSKFARGNRFSIAEHQERYKDECQRLFNLQNKLLQSKDILSTDEESEPGEESEIEEMGKNIENMLSNKKTSAQISHEREEAERKQLNKAIESGHFDDSSPKKKKDDEDGKRTLRITRTFRNEDGSIFTRTEIVKKQAVIDVYVRVRQNSDGNQTRSFNPNDPLQMDDKRDKKKFNDISKRSNKGSDFGISGDTSPRKHNKKRKEQMLKLKCGACGAVGHMRTNKVCPLYKGGGTASGTSSATPTITNTSSTPKMSGKQHDDVESKSLVDEDLINVEGTKLVISKQLVRRAEEVKQKSLLMKFNNASGLDRKRKRAGTDVHCDYLDKRSKVVSNRRRADPVVSMTTIFENILNEMRDLPDTQPFLFAVNGKTVPDYYQIVKNPMDLQTIRENLRNKKYLCRETFILDVNLIVKNSQLYNGPKSMLTVTAQRMIDKCLQRIAEKEDKLMKLEKCINPLLDDNDQNAFEYILKAVINERLIPIEGSYPFHYPVKKKFFKDYYDVIKQPMDFSKLLQNVNQHCYHSSEDFLNDVQLIVANCKKYNGPESKISETAQLIYDTAVKALQEQEETISGLEENIRKRREAMLDFVDTDSVVTGTSITGTEEPGGMFFFN
ncbi:DgyrCDS4450 [Dimorphilus gyrociliatus]|uniref:Transcription initiation factor TFIID subunit 1 n=1 Tax=Dimorphilus gyrociliatus TaxID=2664684 RepID=A0A7I8VII3_9ANNE|nr:DgyrCDS4450 [Dimorphilus gyrociliatus]